MPFLTPPQTTELQQPSVWSRELPSRAPGERMVSLAQGLRVGQARVEKGVGASSFPFDVVGPGGLNRRPTHHGLTFSSLCTTIMSELPYKARHIQTYFDLSPPNLELSIKLPFCVQKPQLFRSIFSDFILIPNNVARFGGLQLFYLFSWTLIVLI